MTEQLAVSIGILLIIAGLVLAFLSVILPSLRSGNIHGRGGAVIIIGPFPIVLGSDRETARSLLFLAIMLVVVLIALFLFQIL